MSNQTNLSELATRRQSGHLFDSVEQQLLDLPRLTVQEIVKRGTSRYQKLHQQVVDTLVTEFGIPVYPNVGEIFELTLDGDAPENQPLQMVRDFGYTGKWQHNGPKVKGKQTRRFKLAQAGYQPNLDGVKSALPGSGSVEGQWIKAFKAAYPQPDGEGLIGIADASWVYPFGSACFPVVNSDGGLDFIWAGLDQGGRWRWLVPAE